MYYSDASKEHTYENDSNEDKLFTLSTEGLRKVYHTLGLHSRDFDQCLFSFE